MTSTTLDHLSSMTRPVATGESGQAIPTTIAAPGLRLTRRGRLVVVLSVLLAACGGLTLRGAPAASTDVMHHTRTATVVVSPGQTVWDIAARIAPRADIRATVAEIERLNSLPDAGSVRVGQPLFVPLD
jgi:hypothetical protein